MTSLYKNIRLPRNKRLVVDANFSLWNWGLGFIINFDMGFWGTIYLGPLNLGWDFDRDYFAEYGGY